MGYEIPGIGVIGGDIVAGILDKFAALAKAGVITVKSPGDLGVTLAERMKSAKK